MIIADYLPQTDMIQTSDAMVKAVIMDEPTKLSTESSESMPINDNASSITPIKIPLVSFEPILATSPNYILVNESTKRRKNLTIFDDQLQKFIIRSPIREPLLDALWYDNQQTFLLLTENNIFVLNPNTEEIQSINELVPEENKIFKCFTLLNQCTLLIAYNEWDTEYIDKWQQNNEDGLWRRIERQPLKLTTNEFIENMIKDDDCSYLMITIYNSLTEQWRMEVRDSETFILHKAILLPGSNENHDYRMVPIKDAQSDIKWLVFSSKKSIIIAIDSNWKKIQLNYKYAVQRMALFRENYLIVRTTDKVDIHSFM